MGKVVIFHPLTHQPDAETMGAGCDRLQKNLGECMGVGASGGGLTQCDTMLALGLIAMDGDVWKG